MPRVLHQRVAVGLDCDVVGMPLANRRPAIDRQNLTGGDRGFVRSQIDRHAAAGYWPMGRARKAGHAQPSLRHCHIAARLSGSTWSECGGAIRWLGHLVGPLRWLTRYNCSRSQFTQTNNSWSMPMAGLADSISLSRNSPPQNSQHDEGGGSTRMRI